MKRIAVVILNYNGAEMLRRFLPNVLENSPEANVYVADNGWMPTPMWQLVSPRSFPIATCPILNMPGLQEVSWTNGDIRIAEAEFSEQLRKTKDNITPYPTYFGLRGLH